MDIKERMRPQAAVATANALATGMHVEKRWRSAAMNQDAPVIVKR